MLSKFLLFFSITIAFGIKSQIVKDYISSRFPLMTNANSNERKEFYLVAGSNEYIVYGNSNDTIAFDLQFSKQSLKKYSDKEITIKLKDGNNLVFDESYKKGYFEYTYLTNVPSCSDCFTIRIRLNNKYNNLIYNTENESKSYKLFLYSGNTLLYGGGPKDLSFKFLTHP